MSVNPGYCGQTFIEDVIYKIDILNKLNCDYLVFGSETNDVSLFENLVKVS